MNVGRDLREDRGRSWPDARQHLECRLASLLGTTQMDEEVGAVCADLDQLALEIGGDLLEIRGPGVHVEPQADQRSVRDPDVDVPRRRWLAARFSPIDYRRTMNRRRKRS